MLKKVTVLIAGFFMIVFILPVALSLVWWSLLDRPQSWREADWSSANLLPAANRNAEAVIHVFSARTGGLKGALSQHSWIVLKRTGAARYDRYDKVGWGRPVRKNAYAPDARWYSNSPRIVATVRGKAAAKLIPVVEKAIANYPHNGNDGYRIWPGPNSNSFVAHILREVPEIGAVLPSNAVGRDFLSGGKVWHVSKQGDEFKAAYNGLAGIALGRQSGFEINILGLVAGVDILRPALKVPGFGRLEL